jgi:hypothetical protein
LSTPKFRYYKLNEYWNDRGYLFGNGVMLSILMYLRDFSIKLGMFYGCGVCESITKMWQGMILSCPFQARWG